MSNKEIIELSCEDFVPRVVFTRCKLPDDPKDVARMWWLAKLGADHRHDEILSCYVEGDEMVFEILDNGIYGGKAREATWPSTYRALLSEPIPPPMSDEAVDLMVELVEARIAEYKEATGQTDGWKNHFEIFREQWLDIVVPGRPCSHCDGTGIYQERIYTGHGNQEVLIEPCGKCQVEDS